MVISRRYEDSYPGSRTESLFLWVSARKALWPDFVARKPYICADLLMLQRFMNEYRLELSSLPRPRSLNDSFRAFLSANPTFPYDTTYTWPTTSGAQADSLTHAAHHASHPVIAHAGSFSESGPRDGTRPSRSHSTKSPPPVYEPSLESHRVFVYPTQTSTISSSRLLSDTACLVGSTAESEQTRHTPPPATNVPSQPQDQASPDAKPSRPLIPSQPAPLKIDAHVSIVLSLQLFITKLTCFFRLVVWFQLIIQTNTLKLNYSRYS